MRHTEIIAYYLKKPGAYLDYPFNPVFPAIKAKAPLSGTWRHIDAV